MGRKQDSAHENSNPNPDAAALKHLSVIRPLLLALVMAAGCSHDPARSSAVKASPIEAPQGDASLAPGPCPEPLESLESGSCLAMPEDATAETPVIVYLHGMTSSPEMARISAGILGQASVANGIAMLAPLGAKGNCRWKPEVVEYWCWPGDVDQGEGVDRFLDVLDTDLRLVQRRLGQAHPIRPVLVGYSNGGFMAMRLVSRSAAPYSSLVIVHAGEPRAYSYPASPLPTLLRTATGDAWHFPTMEKLRDALAARDWPITWSVREGEHRFTESDAEAIVDFLSR